MAMGMGMIGGEAKDALREPHQLASLVDQGATLCNDLRGIGERLERITAALGLARAPDKQASATPIEAVQVGFYAIAANHRNARRLFEKIAEDLASIENAL